MAMEVFVGTSGWYYEWNQERTLDWYLDNSQLNAIELNASFYRFPFPNQVKAWARKGKLLHWVIKVSRLITHQYKFSEKSIDTWQKFLDLFSVMDNMIDYFLFQLPPSLTERSRAPIENFVNKTKINPKVALEPRNESWFSAAAIRWARSLGVTWVSVDAPELPRDIFKTTDCVYLRMHGRTSWYQHNYTNKEFKEIGKKILDAKPKSAYVFFNNDHNMLKNAQTMQTILKDAVLLTPLLAFLSPISAF